MLELSGVGASAADGGSEAGGEFDILADERAQEALHVGDDGVDVDDLEFEKLFAAEGEELAGERGGAIGGLLNGFGLGVQRVAGGELVEENLGVAADDHEQIVEVVSDAAGEAADGFHFLGLAELVFEDAAFGDVFGDGFEDVGGLVSAGDGAAADADGDGGAVFAFPADLETVHAAGAAEFVDQAGVFAGIDENIFLRIEGQHFEGGVVTQHSDEGRVDVEKAGLRGWSGKFRRRRSAPASGSGLRSGAGTARCVCGRWRRPTAARSRVRTSLSRSREADVFGIALENERAKNVMVDLERDAQPLQRAADRRARLRGAAAIAAGFRECRAAARRCGARIRSGRQPAFAGAGADSCSSTK